MGRFRTEEQHQHALQKMREYYARNRDQQRSRGKKYYHDNLEREQARGRISSTRLLVRKREILRELRSGGCGVCGEMDQDCLDFHHVDPSTKKFCVADGRPRSEKQVRAEAAKCVVLCANCHRKLEAQKRREV